MTADHVIIEADGGSRGNPGPAGYGAVVFDAASHAVLAERGEQLTLRQARALANADAVHQAPDVPPAILARARADADRIVCDRPPVSGLYLEMAR